MADSPESEQPAETSPVDDQPADSATTNSATTNSATTDNAATNNAATSADDSAAELKDRFRAALDRKRGAAESRSVRGHGGASGKVHERNRKAGGKRTFRRKSG